MLTLVAITVNEVTELASGAAQMPVKVAARHRPVVAWLYKQTLGRCRLLLLCNNCVHSSLSLLLLRPELCSLHGCNGLLLLELILSFDVVDGVFDHLEKLLVRHAGVVAKQVHYFLALA
jgi:hypothetical protein